MPTRYTLQNNFPSVSRAGELNPAECGNIGYQLNSPLNAFTLTLQAATAVSIQWFDDDNNVTIPGSDTSISIPLSPNCGVRNISVRWEVGGADAGAGNVVEAVGAVLCQSAVLNAESSPPLPVSPPGGRPFQPRSTKRKCQH